MINTLLWLPINAVQLLFVMLWSALCISLALVVRVVSRGARLPLAMARRLWAPVMLSLAPFKLEVSGLDRVDFTRPHFFVANHQSFADIPVLFRVLPVGLHFVVKEELRKVPFLGWYIAAMGMIFIDRGRRARAMDSVQRIGDLVAGGKNVLLFAEGTRSRDGRVRPFKSGVMAAAAASSVPVVPIALDGPGRCLPPGGFKVRPGRIRISIGEPIATDGYAVEDRRALANDVRGEVARLLEELRR